MQMQLRTLQTLADPTRLLIVEALLARGELPVNDLVAAAAIHQSGVSRHLRIIHEAGFVAERPEGAQRFYSLRPEPFLELEGWLARCRSRWEARLDRLGAALERKKKARADKRGR